MSAAKLTKQKLFHVAEIIHLRIFGHEMGEEMRKFLGNLGISFFGGAISSVLLFVVSILVGRFLGPVEYGKYALYMALFSFLAIFFSFGLETAIVRVAAQADKERKKEILSTFVIFFLVNSLFWSLLFLLCSNFITKIFGVPAIFIFFAILFAAINVLGAALENYLKLLNQFVFINIIRIVQGSFLLLSILLLYFFSRGLFSLEQFIILNIVVVAFALITFLLRVRAFIDFVFDRGILRELFLFSSVIFLGVISGYLIQNGTNILINKFIGSRELGLYSAYYTLSVLVTGQFIAFFAAVYFPAVAQAGDRVVIAKKIERIFPLFGGVWFLLTALVMFVGLKMYGEEYPIDYFIIFLFSLYSLFNLYGSLFGFITISGGDQIVVRNLFLSWFCIVILYFAFLWILGIIGMLTLYTVLLSYVTIFFANAVLNKYFCNKYLSTL